MSWLGVELAVEVLVHQARAEMTCQCLWSIPSMLSRSLPPGASCLRHYWHELAQRWLGQLDS